MGTVLPCRPHLQPAHGPAAGDVEGPAQSVSGLPLLWIVHVRPPHPAIGKPDDRHDWKLEPFGGMHGHNPDAVVPEGNTVSRHVPGIQSKVPELICDVLATTVRKARCLFAVRSPLVDTAEISATLTLQRFRCRFSFIEGLLTTYSCDLKNLCLSPVSIQMKSCL